METPPQDGPGPARLALGYAGPGTARPTSALAALAVALAVIGSPPVIWMAFALARRHLLPYGLAVLLLIVPVAGMVVSGAAVFRTSDPFHRLRGVGLAQAALVLSIFWTAFAGWFFEVLL